jgi:hypothetical protein
MFGEADDRPQLAGQSRSRSVVSATDSSRPVADSRERQLYR